MKKKKKGNLVIFIFPYLFINKELKFNGYVLKPSYQESFSKESSRVKAHLTRIVKSFSFRGVQNINQYSYGFTTVHEGEWEKLKASLDILSTILRYKELSDERSSANYSNFDYVVFELNRPMSNKKYGFYDGVLNGRNSIKIYFPKTKYSPNYDISPYIFDTDVNDRLITNFLRFSKHLYGNDEHRRLVRSLEWFNRSLKSDPETDDLEKFICIAIAFEILFKSPEQGIVSAIKVGITTLLGESEQMERWFKNFYEQRSAISHGREVPSTLYQGANASRPHISHLRFARKVFSRCIKALMVSRENVLSIDLHRDLVSNEERLKEVLSIISKAKNLKDLAESGVFETIDSLNTWDLSGKGRDVLAVAKILLPFIKPYLQEIKRNDILAEIETILKFKGSELRELALVFGRLHDLITPIYFDHTPISLESLPLVKLKGSVWNFTSYATWKLLTIIN